VATGAWLGSSWRFPQRQPLPQLQVSPHWHPGRRLVLLAFDVFVDIVNLLQQPTPCRPSTR
jgi:hypothetical protein